MGGEAMRVLVCGGRDLDPIEWVEAVREVLWSYEATLVIHGGARGGDHAGELAARAEELQSLIYPAEWGRHGRAAGPIRNQRMLIEGRPDLVVALPGSRGTADMKRRARAAGVPVLEIDPEGAEAPSGRRRAANP